MNRIVFDENVFLQNGELSFASNIYDVYDVRTNEKIERLIGKRYASFEPAKREYTCLLKLGNMRGIPRLCSSIRNVDGKNYILFEREGKSDLFEIVTRGELKSKKAIKHILRELLKILVQIHAKGIIHLDLKLENIMYDSESKSVVLIDFDQKITPHYSPPETILDGNIPRKLPYSSAFDIWGVGVCAYLMLYRTIPDRNNPLQDFERLHPESTDRCKVFLEKCFKKKPSDRPSALELLEDEWVKGDKWENVQENLTATGTSSVQ